MTVVRSTLNVAPGATVSAVLSGPSGFKLDHSEQVTGQKVIAGTDGSWSMDLPAQSLFRYPGSVWVIRHKWATHYVVVPDSGPVCVDDIEVSAPGSGSPPTPSLYLTRAERGAVNGVASLDGTGKVPTSQLPAGGGGAPSWDDVTGKPSTFPPSAHTHPQSDVTGLSASLTAKADQVDLDTLEASVPVQVATRAPKLVVRTQQLDALGRITLPNTSGSWAPLSGFLLTCPAVVGDYIEVQFGGVKKPGYAAIDVAVLVSGSIVRAMSNGTSTPAVEGTPAWNSNVENFLGGQVVSGFIAGSGDLSGGNVTLAVVTKTTGTETLDASTAYPFQWKILNHGPTA